MTHAATVSLRRAARDVLYTRVPRRIRRALGWHRRRDHGIGRTALALVAAGLLGGPAWAGPTGAQVTAGDVQLSTSVPDTLDIRQGSNKAIIQWRSFDVGVGETVNFLQPSSKSVTLNRVTGGDASAILGRVRAPGTVMLVNPQGIVFGPQSRVDVGGLVATTADVADEDFLASRYRFEQASPYALARIVNEGEISIRDSGLAALVAPSVHNAGRIEARLGRIALAGAERFELDFHGDGLLSFAAGPGRVTNTGTLRADGGRVLLSARAVASVLDEVVNTQGIVEATTVGVHEGRIVLSGGSAADGGRVVAGGTIAARGEAAGTHGGHIEVNGRQVVVEAGATLDASGAAGGGEIALGSRGRDAAVPFADKASTVDVARGAQLRADALDRGDGGTVTLWSTDRTTHAGVITARGGAAGGDGGFAEVSSLRDIGLQGDVDLRARSAAGRSGTLLIDPTDLRITDAASGASQDGAAADGQVAAGDADQGSGATLNTISRGRLESLTGSASIVLEASGQITVDAMAGGVIDLATTAGHGFTLRSTTTGGIRFADSATEIRTQGGDITLEARGVGSTLSPLGKLSSNGGAITLSSSGDIRLGGAVNAGSGAVSMLSTAGSVAVADGATPLVSGGTVALRAPGGSVGAAGAAVPVHTGVLTLESGGHVHAASDSALSQLSLIANHVAPTGGNVYDVSAPGLVFAATDGASLQLTQAAQTGLDLTLASDRTIALGSVDVGSGDLVVQSTGGNLTGSGATQLTAASITLGAEGSSGNNGAVGTSGQPLNTTTGHLVAVAGTGGVTVANTGALALDRLSATGSSAITASGTLTAGSVNAGSATLALGSSGGSVLDDGSAGTTITAGTLQLTAGGAIGSVGTRLSTTASTVSANAGSGGIRLGTSATSTVLSSITSGDGAIDITTGGSTTLTSIVSSSSSASNGITVAATGTGSFSVGTVNAGALGDVTLTTTSGSIFGNSGLITGETVTLTAANSGSVTVRTAASHLDVQAGSSSISITQTGSVTLDRLSTPSTLVSVTNNSGDITVGSVSTSSFGQVSLTASAGSIVDDGNSATRISTGTAQLSASGAIGAPGQGVQTKATGLTASSTGDLVVTNSDATLTSLSLTNRHSAPGNAGTLQVDSPYLTFDVTDTGTSYTLDRLVGVPLNTLSFNGDTSLVVGQVQATGSVSLTSTQGSLVDDGNLNTRATAGSTLTLSAAQGSVGSLANPIGANASTLTATTRGDLYVTDIADLSTLTITSTHPDTTTSFGMGITAPSLKFEVTDSAAGHAVQTLTDTSSLTLNFSSDRDITLGRVDVSNTGTARFTASTGNILDDGDKTTRVLANSTTLSARAVGATGNGHLDVVTGTLAASASAGGVYVELPMPTGSTNTTSTVTLGTVTATGPVAITALEGDLSLGGFLTATNQAVSLTAAQGSILSPFGYGIAIGTGSLTLDAAKAIGASGLALPVTNSTGATLSAQAGTSMVVSASGAMTLSSLDATAGITYTQSSGALTVGHVDATAGGTVSLTATSGAIQDDGNGATGIRANQVTLSAAQSSVGSSGAAIAVDAPKLLVTANGNVNVADSATLDTLSLTRGSGSSGSIALSGGAGQTFTLSEDGSEHHLQQIESATPLAFSFSGQRNVKVGSIDVGSAGSASISSAASLVDDGVSGSTVAAGTVSLTAGSTGSIGATGAGNGISLEGTTALTLRAGRNMFVASDSALDGLSVTSTNTTTAVGTASQFGLAGLGQTFAITDSGTTQSLAFSGTALGSFSYTNSKNIEAGAVAATGDVTLVTSGGGANSNISSDAGSGRIAGNRVLLTATSSTAGGGSIGSNSRSLRVDTPTMVLNGSANVYVADAQSLTALDMTLTHGTNTTFGYDVTAGNLTLGISDGSTQGLSLATSGSMDFSYSVDRALSLGTIDAGTSSAGTISLTSRSAPTGTSPRINRGSGSLTAGRISLSAVGTNGGVGVGGTLSTNTENLSVASGGNVSISNSTTLASLSLDAQHRTSGSSTHSYSISSTGLTFSISDSVGSNAFQISNITQSGLELSVKADRTITATRVNTGAGGKATLQSSSAIQGGSGANAGSPSITTGDLVLKGGSAYGYQGSTPLYTAAGTLGSTLTNTLYLSNAGELTLGVNTVGSSADVASSNNSLVQGNGGLFTAPTLKLSANQSLGATGALLTDARRLTLVSRGNVDVSNASDLYALSLTSTHGTPGTQNTLAVAAPRLALALSDSVGGNEYHLSNLTDSSGLDLTLSTDVALNLGTVNAQAGRALALYSTGTGTDITNDGSSLLTAGSITLSASGSVGAAGSSATRLQTDALGLALITGANAYADNARDLTSLSLTSTQNPGGSAPVYQVTAPSLSFDITDDGVTHVNNVADSTGLNFTLSTVRDQAVGTIDVSRSGTVSLTSTGDILGDADSSKRITAASAALTASSGGALGSVGNPIHLSAPLATFAPTGALNVESDTHIDRLGIAVTHPTVTYGGTYSIVSVPLTGPAYALFTATDSVTGTALTSLYDPLGLAFSFTSDRAMQVGTLDLGQTGTVDLTGTGSGGILGDGNPNTRVSAASLNMASLGGAVGATGSGNGIDATVNALSASALGGGVNLALHGRTLLGGISGTGTVNVTSDEGDIALGDIDAQGNAVTINNQGGSILSGSIVNTTTVSLTASGSIGNDSAVGTSANGGGTTTLTASASAAHGASGSIAVSESYNLTAASVTAPAAVTLDSNLALTVGTVTSGGAVALESAQGSISGSNGSNAITGTRVTLSARYGTGNALGSSGVRLNVNTPQLVLNTPGSVYVTDSADLNLLTLDRTNYLSSGSGGTLSVIASGLTFSATDSSNTTTLTGLADGTGLDFSYLGVGSLAVGSLNAGSSGTVLLQASLDNGDGHIDAINNSSLITAGSLTLRAYGSDSHIGSSGTPLGLAVGALTASSGTGGLYVRQAGSLSLSSLSTTGDLAVTASSGDLTLGTLSYGSARTLSLTASGGSILAGGGTLAGGGSNAAITLSAANGIGTATAPIRVNASAGHTLNASVTGTGSLFLSSLGTLNGGLTTSVHDGATTVTAAGHIKLTAMSTGTDRAGNDIKVTASAGDITAVSVSGGSGAEFNAIDLSANAGRLLAAPGATLEAFDVKLHGATGVGSSTDRMAANGQRVQVSSSGGAIYLTAATPSVLSSIESAGGAINITHADDLLLANALSSGGAITVASTSAGAGLFAGNLNAGSGALTISSTGAGGTIQDDGNRSTVLAGGTVSLTATGGVGEAALSVQTSAATLNVSSGQGIYIDDVRSAGVNLASVVATGGAVSVGSAGPTTATLVQASADSAGNNVTLATSSGDLTLVSVTAGATHGAVDVSAAGSILASGSGTHITGHSATLTAGEDIGVVTDLNTGAGTPVKLDVDAISGLSSSGSNRVVSVLNIGTTALSLGGGALSLGSGSSAYISTAGDLDVSAGLALAGGNLSLNAGGTLVLPTTAISTTGAVRLTGSTDILTSGSGAAARDLHVSGSSLVLRSGAAGGDTQLTTAVGSLDAALSGAGDLVVTNTGTLTATTLATSNGDISATSSTGMTAGSVVAGGTGRSISLTAATGDLDVGTVNAGSNGSIALSAAQGALSGASATLVAHTLDLTSGQGIGSSGAAFATNAAQVSAQATGTGGIYLSSGSALTLGNLSTNDGDIAVTAAGDLTAGAVSAGHSGNVALTSTGGNVNLTQAYTQAGSDSSRAGLSLQGQAINVGAVSTTGAQSYTGALTVGGNLAGSSIAVNGNATLTGGVSTLSGDLHITGTLVGAGNALALHAGSGSVVLDGAASGLASLSVTGASIQLANVTTTGGAQAYQGATTLNGSYATQGGAFSVNGAAQLGGATTVATGGGQASFGGTLDGASALSVTTGSGDALFSGAVGQTTRLAGLAVTSAGATRFEGAVAAGSLVTDAAGTLALDGGSVNTTGAQSWGERLVLGSHTVLAGTTLTLGQGADASVAGQQGLTLSGQAVLPAALGATAALASLTVSGDTTLDGGAVVTTGAQVYGGAVSLGADTQLTGTGISFGSSVNGGVALTVQAGSGATSFGGAVGDTTRLGALVVNSSGATTFGGAVRAASVSTDAAGTLALNGGSVHTTGAQVYGERAVLGADTTLTGSSVGLAGGADATTAGGQGLTIAGDATLGGAVGAQQALASLDVTGATTLAAAQVRTTGGQQYASPVLLGTATQLRSEAGDIALTGTVDGAHALTIDAGSGDVLLGADVGAVQRLGALTLNSSGTTTVGATVRAASVSSDAAGALVMDATVDTTGAQAWGERMVLARHVTLRGSSVHLQAGADATAAGAQGLVIDGAATLDGDLGAQQALSSLTVGAATLGAGTTFTTGAQAYGSAVTLAGARTLTSSVGTITFDGAVDGAHALQVEGDVRFGADVGTQQALTSLGVTGATTLAAAQVRTTGAQLYAGPVVLGTGTQLRSEGGSIALTGAIDGAHALTIDAGSGDVLLGADVGAVQRLGALTINSSGTTTVAGTVRAASVATDATGSLVLSGGSVDTTGEQAWGERARLAADTLLRGSTVRLLGGADAAAAGAQALTIEGTAVIGGPVGAQQALATLDVTGAAVLTGNRVETTGRQAWAAGLQVGADSTLRGSEVEVAGVDAAVGTAPVLQIDADAVLGPVGVQRALGGLTVGGASRLTDGRVVTSGMQDHAGAVTTDPGVALQLQAGSLAFGGTTTAASVTLTLTDPDGTVTYDRDAQVQAAGGYQQSGGALVVLPSLVYVEQGSIDIGTLAVLPTGTARLEAGGSITISGLRGLQTDLTLATSHVAAPRGVPSTAGPIVIGSASGSADRQLQVRSLLVPDAGSAALFGSLGGRSGSLAATMVDSVLVGAPYYFNGTPWGPLDTVATLIASTLRPSVVPSAPGAAPLFAPGTPLPRIAAPGVLQAYGAPTVLTVSPAFGSVPAVAPTAPTDTGRTPSTTACIPNGAQAGQGDCVAAP